MEYVARRQLTSTIQGVEIWCIIESVHLMHAGMTTDIKQPPIMAPRFRSSAILVLVLLILLYPHTPTQVSALAGQGYYVNHINMQGKSRVASCYLLLCLVWRTIYRTVARPQNPPAPPLLSQ
jgi:hypothetical protein